MTTATTTPGPWEIVDVYDADLLNENPPRRETVWEIGNRDFGNSPAYATSEEDARLIAAAPRLLDELQQLRDWIPQWMIGDEVEAVCASIDDAIAQATKK